jgi:hypothetical protein
MRPRTPREVRGRLAWRAACARRAAHAWILTPRRTFVFSGPASAGRFRGAPRTEPPGAAGDLPFTRSMKIADGQARTLVLAEAAPDESPGTVTTISCFPVRMR